MALKSMQPLKASGEGGLGAVFYQRHIIGREEATFCIDSSRGIFDMLEINHTRIVLIPKVNSPTLMSHFPLLAYVTFFIKLFPRC